MVSGDATTMTLPAKIVKNKEPITLALTTELTAVLKKQFRQDWSACVRCDESPARMGLSDRSREVPRIAHSRSASFWCPQFG
jgi:hypothetical protein